MTTACNELAELRSAFVDGALDAVDYDRLSAHLAGCHACRRDVQDLRTVHDLVRANGWVAGAPAELSQRLVSIGTGPGPAPGAAGPPRVGRPGRIPRVRVAVAALAVGAVLVTAGATGYLAAPDELAAIADPASDAETEFSSVLGQLPLGSDPVGAAVAVDSAALVTVAAAASAAPSVPPSGAALTASEAEAGLQAAVKATESLSYVGEQSFVAHSAGHTYAARMQVVSQTGFDSRTGADSQISVVSQNGKAVASDVSQPAGSARFGDDGLLDLLSRNYDLGGARGVMAAGRPATLLQATRAGTLAARWWVDDRTGLVLWHERFDDGGALRTSTGFTSFEPRDQPDLVQPLAKPEATPTTTVTLTLSHAGALVDRGWACGSELAGMTLTRLRADQPNDPRAVLGVYSDGLDTVSVHERRGRLVDPPDGATWDAGSQSWIRFGVSNLASWQSGDTVITVITDGSPELLSRAVARLPHAEPQQRTTMERIQAGWVQILATVTG